MMISIIASFPTGSTASPKAQVWKGISLDFRESKIAGAAGVPEK